MDPDTLLEWLSSGHGEDNSVQLVALEQLCMTLLMSDNVDRCFERCVKHLDIDRCALPLIRVSMWTWIIPKWPFPCSRFTAARPAPSCPRSVRSSSTRPPRRRSSRWRRARSPTTWTWAPSARTASWASRAPWPRSPRASRPPTRPRSRRARASRSPTWRTSSSSASRHAIALHRFLLFLAQDDAFLTPVQ